MARIYYDGCDADACVHVHDHKLLYWPVRLWLHLHMCFINGRVYRAHMHGLHMNVYGIFHFLVMWVHALLLFKQFC